jgi:hypothetical protein
VIGYWRINANPNRSGILLCTQKMEFMKNKLQALILLITIFTCSSVVAESPRFIDNKNGTVTDSKSKLMWQLGDSHHELKAGLTWYEAVEYVDGQNLAKYGGHSDWRLPSMDELRGIWDSQRKLLSKDGEQIGLPTIFKGEGSYYLWSGDERNLDNAWYFGLGQMEDYFNLKDLGDLDQGVKMVRNMN